MKKLIFTVAFTLIATSLPATAWADGKSNYPEGAHLFNSAAIPSKARSQNANHKFEVHVLKKPISELSIYLPEKVSLSKDIEVTDKTGQKIDAQTSIDSGKATIAFAQPVSPDTVIRVNLRGVRTSGFDQNWLYRVYSKKVGLTAEIPLGTAEVRTYSSN
ncbi:hypothetical protein NIES4102_40930 (plasmid) [Chondrocystis sp. NIES-4102]|nr:hypothetical protein NIES4102_40930 [Chondrocystis sp. NIES-4102]